MGDRIKSKPTQRVKMLKYKESQREEKNLIKRESEKEN